MSRAKHAGPYSGKALTIRTVEGVPYRRFRVTFCMSDGRRRRWVRWSPGFPWITDEVCRELVETIGADNVKPHSCRIEAV